MRVCVFCKFRYLKGSGITFHKFPTDSTKQLWLKNMKMENSKSNDHLCSKHFTEDCFIKHATRTSLKNGSVPKIFNGNTISLRDNMVTPTPCVSETAGVKRKLSSSNEATTRSSQKKARTILDDIENIDHDHHYKDIQSSSVSEICTENVRHDHCYESTPKSTKKQIQQLKKSLNLARARVKVLSQHVKRLKMKNGSVTLHNYN